MSPVIGLLEREASLQGVSAKGLPEVNALYTENTLVFAIGPLAELPVFSGSKWIVCGKSPMPTPEQFCHRDFAKEAQLLTVFTTGLCQQC